MINLFPTRCNLCSGAVEYISNAKIYGREYGSGKCYLCTKCGAYVGTHKPRPKEALGVLADEPMRALKISCHELFDARWQGKPNAAGKRSALYRWLANKLGIDVSNCHFGHFDLPTLQRAHTILQEASSNE